MKAVVFNVSMTFLMRDEYKKTKENIFHSNAFHFGTTNNVIINFEYVKEDVGLVYVIEKYETRGVLFMII